MAEENKINTKSVTLYAYKIMPQNIMDRSSDLQELFINGMEKLKTVEDRMLRLNPKSDDSDCLLFQANHGDNIFCTLARLAPSKTVGNFPDELLKKESVTLNELPPEAIIGLKYKRITYIYLGKSFVITNLYSANNFETYINEMIERTGGNLFLLKPYLEQQKKVKLSDVKRVRIGEGFNINVSSNETWTKIKTIPKEVLNILIEKGVVVDELIKNDLVSAEVNLKFERKPKEMSNEEYDELLSNALSLNNDGVIIEKKSGGSINAGDLHKRIKTTIEILSGDLLNEVDLKKEMSKFLGELESVKTEK